MEVWFDVPADAAPQRTRSDAFAVAALIPAMRLGTNLLIEGPVSRDLLTNLEHLRTVYSDWFPGFSAIDIQASTEVQPAGPPERGVFFSGGVDSFHTAVTAPELADHLIHVVGFDTLREDDTLLDRIRSSIRAAAGELDRPLIEVETNVRALIAPHADWPRNHTIALAAVGHALSGSLGGCVMAADRSYLGKEPFASHPIMIQSLGSERLSLQAHGWATSRVEKMDDLLGSATAMAHLRVCWENREGAFNCGVCDKCLRTRVDLVLTGAADRCTTFQGSLDLTLVAGIEIARPSQRDYVDTALRRARSSGNHQIAAALEEAVRRADARDASGRIGPDFAAIAHTDRVADFVAEHRDALYDNLSAHHGRWLVVRVLRSLPGRIWRKITRS